MRSSLDQQQMTFEDLKGLGARGYVRDSKLDQRDGFGSDIQQSNIRRFVENYGLLLGERSYTEFVSGRSAEKRSQFEKLAKSIIEAGEDDNGVVLINRRCLENHLRM